MVDRWFDLHLVQNRSREVTIVDGCHMILRGLLTVMEVLQLSFTFIPSTSHTWNEVAWSKNRIMQVRHWWECSTTKSRPALLHQASTSSRHRSPVTSTICVRQKSIRFNTIPSHRYSQGQMSDIFRIGTPRSLIDIDICFAVCKYEITSPVLCHDKEVIKSKYDTDIPSIVTQRGRHFCDRMVKSKMPLFLESLNSRSMLMNFWRYSTPNCQKCINVDL